MNIGFYQLGKKGKKLTIKVREKINDLPPGAWLTRTNEFEGKKVKDILKDMRSRAAQILSDTNETLRKDFKEITIS